jgi:hypothetical protein
MFHRMEKKLSSESNIYGLAMVLSLCRKSTLPLPPPLQVTHTRYPAAVAGLTDVAIVVFAVLTVVFSVAGASHGVTAGWRPFC